MKNLIARRVVIASPSQIGDVPLDLGGQPAPGWRVLGARLEPGAVDGVERLAADLVQTLHVKATLAITHGPQLLSLVHVLKRFPERLLFALLGLRIDRRGLRAFPLQPVETFTKLPGLPQCPPLGLRRSAVTGYIPPRLPFFFICGGRPTLLIGTVFGTLGIVGGFVEDFFFGLIDVLTVAPMFEL